jgi:hypothetical protein
LYKEFLKKGVRNQIPIIARGRIRGARAQRLVPDSRNAQATVATSKPPYTIEPIGSAFHNFMALATNTRPAKR